MDGKDVERVLALRDLNILDTAPELELDELTQLAALICKTPIALISLVDKDRQWFKSRVGISVTETAREVSFCSVAIEQSELFIVSDALLDSRFQKNPLVLKSPHIRFYAGAPLFASNGFALGTLCIIDSRPREMDELQMMALKILAKQVVKQIESRKINRQLHQSLKVSEERQSQLSSTTLLLKDLIENIQAGIVVEGKDRQVLFINTEFCRMFGNKDAAETPLAQAAASIFETMGLSASAPGVFTERIKSILEAKTIVLNEEIEFSNFRTFERDYVPFMIGESHEGNLWLYRDVSDRKQIDFLLKEQALQIVEAQKLSSLGEMAGGLAHEINNPLAIIYGRAQHLQELAGKGEISPERIVKYSTDIVEVTQRLMRIIKGLRSFARDGDKDQIEPAALDSIVKDTLEFCQQKIKDAGIQLKFSSESPEILVNCRATQISQIVLNLLNNSFDAIRTLDKPWIAIDIYRSATCGFISVTDSGPGIEESIQAKIFRPFFTTKLAEHGTGIGLSISQKIAVDQGGSLYLDKESKQTRFILMLPRSPN